MKNTILIIVITALIAGISACASRETVKLVVLATPSDQTPLPKPMRTR
ncbi:MAG: hypothetical protein HND47_24630 [Chloroflexi bacterium]|nr:hypothetical protein [Chloroflexota bacterium]